MGLTNSLHASAVTQWVLWRFEFWFYNKFCLWWTCRLPSGKNLKIMLWKKALCREKQENSFTRGSSDWAGLQIYSQNKLLQMTNPINYIESTIWLKHFMSFLVSIQCEWSQYGETLTSRNGDIFTCICWNWDGCQCKSYYTFNWKKISIAWYLIQNLSSSLICSNLGKEKY